MASGDIMIRVDPEDMARLEEFDAKVARETAWARRLAIFAVVCSVVSVGCTVWRLLL